MAQYLVEDRRRKPEGEHLENVVKVRFTDAEMEALQASASMNTEGRLAPISATLCSRLTRPDEPGKPSCSPTWRKGSRWMPRAGRRSKHCSLGWLNKA